MREVNISLPDDFVKFAEKQVELGRYKDISEVFKEALRMLDDIEYNVKLERLKQILKPSLEQADNGEYSEYSYEELMADLDKS